MDVRSVFRRHAALSRITGDALEEIAKTATQQRLRRGEAVWRSGESASSFVLVGLGLVKVLMPGGPSRDLVLGLAGPGESVGDAEALEAGFYDADAFALTESVIVVRVPREVMLAALEKSGPASLALAIGLGRSGAVANRRLALFTASAEERLVTTLMELGERFGELLHLVRELAGLRTLREVRVEAAELGRCDVQADVGVLQGCSVHDLGLTDHERKNECEHVAPLADER